jgi:predicted esterase
MIEGTRGVGAKFAAPRWFGWESKIMRHRVWVGAVLAVVLWGRTAPAQQFVERVYQDADGAHKYAVFVPAGYSPQRKSPAILFLHGAGERGTDGRKPTLIGLGPYAKARGSAFPFLVVFPQVEDTRGRLLTPWQAGQPDAERALKILDDVQQNYAVDAQRIALVGWSMGGYGAWSLGAAHPQKWSGVAALSGGGNPEQVAALKDVPVWAIHGTRDTLVPVSESQAMVEALKAAGGKVTYHELSDAGHDLSAQVFGNDGFIAWLVDPRTKPAELSATSARLNVEPPPFATALEIPQAVGIRLGNDALKAMSYAAPQLVPPGMLSGRINDMFDSTSAQGRSFSVQFSGISYYGQLDRVQIQAAGTDRVNIQLGLRNITLTIGGTYVSGQRHSAQAGPINIGIGHNQPVWLSLDVTPYVENRRLRLRLIGSNFSIPPESYYVTQPAGVSVSGIGMTQERVVSGLMGGLYGARGRVENEVRNIAPNIVRQLEDQFRLTDAGPIVAGMWPLPVFPPRLRAYPEQVTTDATGISVVLGVAAASPDLTASVASLSKSAPAGVTGTALGNGKSLGVAVAPQLLGPLSQLLIDADLAHVNVLDLPEKSFARLADRKVLEEVLPDLKRFDDTLQVRSELVLAAPLNVDRSSGSNGDADAVPLEFRLPQVRIDVAVRTGDAGKWQPYAQFALAIQEQVAAKLQKPSHERRELQLAWQHGKQITGQGRFVDGANPQDAAVNGDRFVELFRESWDKSTGGLGGATPVPDVEFASTKLRLQELGSSGAVLTGVFQIPTVKLTNLSEENFTYETKGPYSAWGGPYTLAPGKSQEYEIPYPLTYRRGTGAGAEVYTLFAGSHSEYRVPKKGGPPRLFQAP